LILHLQLPSRDELANDGLDFIECIVCCKQEFSPEVNVAIVIRADLGWIRSGVQA